MKKILGTTVSVLAFIVFNIGGLIFLYLIWEGAIMPIFRFLKANSWIVHSYLWIVGGMFVLTILATVTMVVVSKFRSRESIN